MIAANGESIHLVIGGSGSPVVLIHGYPETWYEWRKTMPLLARSHRVIAVDMPGFGESSVPRSGYDKKTLAARIHDAIKTIGISKASLVGHDWGAPVAFAYAAQFRNDVDKLVLVESGPYGPWMKTTSRYWFFDFFRIPGYAEKVLRGREKEFLSYFYHDDHFHRVPGAFDDDTVERYTAAYARPHRMEASYELYRAIDQDVKDNTEFAKDPLTIPVLAVGAEAGAGASVAELARNAASHVNAIVFKDTGHFIPEERPVEFVQAIETFFGGAAPPEEWSPPAH